MMEDVCVKLNLGLLWQKLHSTKEGSFYWHTGFKKTKEETSKMLHLEHSFIWC